MFVVELHPSFFAKLGIGSAAFFWPPNSIPTLVLSVLLFLAFERLEIPRIAAVNRLASTTFGVYLLSDGKLAGVLRVDVFQNASHVGPPALVLHVLSATIAVLAIGAVVDAARQLAEIPVSRTIDRIGIALSEKRSVREGGAE